MSGAIGKAPRKRDNKSKTIRDFLKLIALHVSMEQVGVHGRMSTNRIKVTVTVSTLDTSH